MLSRLLMALAVLVMVACGRDAEESALRSNSGDADQTQEPPVVEPSPTADVPKENHPPIFVTNAFHVQKRAAFAAKISATDDDGDTLIFTVIDPPSHGSLTTFDAATGTLVYTFAEDPVEDAFTVQVTDGRSDPVTQVIPIDFAPFSFAGKWQATNVIGRDSQGSNVTCDDAIITLEQTDASFTMKARSFACKQDVGGTPTIVSFPERTFIIQDGKLMLTNKKVGNITELAISAFFPVGGAPTTVTITKGGESVLTFAESAGATEILSSLEWTL